MFYVYILHKEGSDKFKEFDTKDQADKWVDMQYDPSLFYIVDWSI